MRLSCESYRSKLIQEVSSRVREQRTVKQRVFPSERVWIQVSMGQDTNRVKLSLPHPPWHGFGAKPAQELPLLVMEEIPCSQ